MSIISRIFLTPRSRWQAPVKGYFALGDEADAINNIAVEAANGAIYNIAGQKMESIKNGGLYIVNGKKVVVK